MADNFDPEYELEKRFVKGFRAVFEKDERFVYNKNQNQTGVVITTDFPDDADTPLKIPHAVISDIVFQNNIQTSFGYNYLRDVSVKNIINGAQQYAFIYPYSLTIYCSGTRNASKDLAARVNWWLSLGATAYFSENLGLQITGIQKGRSNLSAQYPEKVFDTPISIQGTLYWVGSKGPENAFHDIDKPLTGVKINFQ